MCNGTYPIIGMNDVVKEFTVQAGDTNVLKTLLFRKKREIRIALSIPYFHVHEGDRVGIIGRNGSGKSTLLKTIAGVYFPNQGQLTTRGRSLYISGYSFTLSPNLSMRRNVFLTAQMFGVPFSKISELYARVIEFSGLVGYDEEYVRQFSSGMYARLGFSCMKEIIEETNPGTLLLDEAFDIGADEAFKTRALTWLGSQALVGRTVLCATHNLESVEKNMTRAIVLEGGKIIFDGDPHCAMDYYRASISS